MSEPTNTAVVGAGYVGLATTALLLDLGHAVSVLDISSARMEKLAEGNSPITEPGLDEILERGRIEERLKFTTNAESALRGISVVFVCVGTPMSRSGDADLSQLLTALETIRQQLTDTVVVIKSTVPPGTNAEMSSAFPELRLVSNPEFLQQGSAIKDSLAPDRIILGSRDREAMSQVRALYEPLASAGATILETEPESAELIKYAANSFLALKVAFINEIADLCEAVEADIDDVAHGIGLDPRIGDRFLRPGPGFGGSCFPKDTQALVATAEQNGVQVSIIDAAARSNLSRRASLADRVERALGEALESTRIGVLGLTFKAGTDDLRESPAVDLVRSLIERGADVTVYDPMGLVHAEEFVPGATMCDNAFEVAIEADALVIATEWPEFADLDFGRIANEMRGSDVIDLRNLLDSKSVQSVGLTLHQIGKPLSGS
jgi:UDPglucose 6-dehydrogenase